MPRFAIAPLGLATEGSTKLKPKGWKRYLKKLQCRLSSAQLGSAETKRVMVPSVASTRLTFPTLITWSSLFYFPRPYRVESAVLARRVIRAGWTAEPGGAWAETLPRALRRAAPGRVDRSSGRGRTPPPGIPSRPALGALYCVVPRKKDSHLIAWDS